MSEFDYGNGSGSLTGVLVGTIVGVVVGAGVALLCAPRSGKETRRILSQKAQDLRDRTRTALEKGKQAMQRESEDTFGSA